MNGPTLGDFIVPSGVTTPLTVTLNGASGGQGGGLGGRTTGSLAVSPGDVLLMRIGGAGTACGGQNCVAAGGFNGGGSSIGNADLGGGLFVSGGSGGGATDISANQTDAVTPGDFLLVAGGGGGGGLDAACAGAGGGLTNGNACLGSGGGAQGQAGGTPGGTTGISGAGSTGANATATGAGGGGGGYVGGGSGGDLGSGGGGSGYVRPASPVLAGATTTSAANSGQGSITFDWLSPTTTTVSCGVAEPGVPTTCSAQVTDVSGIADPAPRTGVGRTLPTGTVSFSSSGSGALSGGGSCGLGGSGFTVSCTVAYMPSELGTGADTITAHYSGDAGHGESTAGAAAQIDRRHTATTLDCAPAVQAGVATTCTVTVADPDGGIAAGPGGTVVLSSTAAPAQGGAGSCDLSAGRCQVTYTPLAIGAQTVTATYSGDTTHAGSIAAAAVHVGARPATTSVTCAPAKPMVHQSIQCTATVSDLVIGATGTVTFSSSPRGSFASGSTCALVGGSCSVTFRPAVSSTQRITAAFTAGDGLHLPGSATTRFVVSGPPQTTITAKPPRITTSTKASFSFTPLRDGTTFRCKLDTTRTGRCHSPKRYAQLRSGKHTFTVYAIDAAGNRDATPASWTWQVRKQP